MVCTAYRVPLVLASLLLPTIFASGVRAADDPCVALGKVMQDRMAVIQQVQGFKNKRPSAQEACSTFTSLAKLNSSSIAALERDGAWCHAPDGAVDGLKGQQGQIETARTNACKAAANQKNPGQAGGAPGKNPAGPLGGTGDILGGPMKLPQGAL